MQQATRAGTTSAGTTRAGQGTTKGGEDGKVTNGDDEPASGKEGYRDGDGKDGGGEGDGGDEDKEDKGTKRDERDKEIIARGRR